MTTLRQIEANRKNAQKSTGPKTEEGKAQSRRSAFKHGLAGSGQVMPEDQEAQTAERLKAWNQEYAPRNPVERWLVERVVRETIRIDHCGRQQSALLTELSINAEASWDDDRRRAAETIAKRLPRDPGLVRLELEATKQGCELIIERWELLLAVLESGEPWNDVHRAMALDMLGVHPDLRGPRSGIDPRSGAGAGGNVVEHQATLARNQIELLTLEISDNLEEADSSDRELAIAGLSVPAGAFRLLYRYEAEAHRRMNRALDRFDAGRRSRPESSQPSFSYQPSPEGSGKRAGFVPPKKMSRTAEHAIHPSTRLTTKEAFFDALGEDYDVDLAMAKVRLAGKWEEWFGNEDVTPAGHSFFKPPPGVAPAVLGVNCRILENSLDLYGPPIPLGPRSKDEPKRR